MHTYLLDIGFPRRTADPRVYNLGSGVVLLFLYVDEIIISGSEDEQGLQDFEKRKCSLEKVNQGDDKIHSRYRNTLSTCTQ